MLLHSGAKIIHGRSACKCKTHTELESNKSLNFGLNWETVPDSFFIRPRFNMLLVVREGIYLLKVNV